MSDNDFELEQEDDVVAASIPAGEYLVRVGHLEMTEGHYGKQIKFRLEICDGEYADESITAWVDAKLTPTSMLSKYVRAFLLGGEDIPDNYKLKSKEFKDTHAYVTCEEYTSGSGAVWPKVTEVAPYDQ